MSAAGRDKEDKNEQHNKKWTFGNRRSSILKTRMDDDREILSNLDVNRVPSATDIRPCDKLKVESSIKRRVSFADTYIVKEFPRDSPRRWLPDETDLCSEKLWISSQRKRFLSPVNHTCKKVYSIERVKQLGSDTSTSEEDTGNITVTEELTGNHSITGLQQLLTAPIQTTQKSEDTAEACVHDRDTENKSAFDTPTMDITCTTSDEQFYMVQKSPLGFGGQQTLEEATEDLAESKIPSLYVPERQYSSNTNKYVGLYNISNENDCATLLNTSVNKYSGIQGRTLALVEDQQPSPIQNECKKVDSGAFLKNLKKLSSVNTTTVLTENVTGEKKVNSLSFINKMKSSTGMTSSNVPPKVIDDRNSISEGNYGQNKTPATFMHQQIDDEEMEFTGCIADNTLSDPDKENFATDSQKIASNLPINTHEAEHRIKSSFLDSDGLGNKKKGLRERESLSESFIFGKEETNSVQLNDKNHGGYVGTINSHFTCTNNENEILGSSNRNQHFQNVGMRKFSEPSQASEMEFTKCVSYEKSQQEITQRFYGIGQDGNLEFTNQKREMTIKFSGKDADADMDFTKCVGDNTEKMKIIQKFSEYNDNEMQKTEMTSTFSDLSKTRKFSSADLDGNMEFTKCIDNSEKPNKTIIFSKTQKDIAPTFSGIDRNRDLEFANQKPEMTIKFSGKDADADMDFTKCIGDDTEKMKTIIKFSECVDNETQNTEMTSRFSELSKTQKFSSTDPDGDMEITKCINNSEKHDKSIIFPQRQKSQSEIAPFSGINHNGELEFTNQKPEMTIKFSGKDADADMDFTKCVGDNTEKMKIIQKFSECVDNETHNTSELSKTQKFSCTDQSGNMEITRCINNSNKTIIFSQTQKSQPEITERFSGIDQNRDMEITNQKPDITIKFSGKDADADMDFTKCVGDNTEKMKTIQKFSECVGNEVQNTELTPRFLEMAKTKKFISSDPDGNMEITKCINNSEKPNKTIIFSQTSSHADMDFTEYVDSRTYKSDLTQLSPGKKNSQVYIERETCEGINHTKLAKIATSNEMCTDQNTNSQNYADSNPHKLPSESHTSSLNEVGDMKNAKFYKDFEVQMPMDTDKVISALGEKDTDYGNPTKTEYPASKTDSVDSVSTHTEKCNSGDVEEIRHSHSSVNSKRKFQQLDSLVSTAELQTSKRYHTLSDTNNQKVLDESCTFSESEKCHTEVSHLNTDMNDIKDACAVNCEEILDNDKPSTTHRTGNEKTVTFDMTVNLADDYAASNFSHKLAKTRNSVGLYKLRKEKQDYDGNLTCMMDISVSDLSLLEEDKSVAVSSGCTSPSSCCPITVTGNSHPVKSSTHDSDIPVSQSLYSVPCTEKSLSQESGASTSSDEKNFDDRKSIEIQPDTISGQSTSPDCLEPLAKKCKTGSDSSCLLSFSSSTSSSCTLLSNPGDDLLSETSSIALDMLSTSKFANVKSSAKKLSVWSEKDENISKVDLKKKKMWSVDDFCDYVGVTLYEMKKSKRKRSSFVPKILVTINFCEIKSFMTTSSAEEIQQNWVLKHIPLISVLSLECNKTPSAMLKHCRWHLVALKKPINKLSDIIKTMAVKKVKFIHDQESMSLFIEEQDRMEEELKHFEESLLIHSPEIFSTARDSTDEEIDKLKMEIEDCKAACRKMAKKWWKEKRQVALRKTLSDLKETSDNLQTDVQDMLNSLEGINKYHSELKEVNKLLDGELDNLSDVQEITEESAMKLRESSQQISTVTKELEKEEEKVKTLTEEKHQLEQERNNLSQTLSKQEQEMEDLRQVEKSVSNKEYRITAWKIDTLKSIHPWHLTDIEDCKTSLSFMFLYDIFRLDIIFQENCIRSPSVLSVDLIEQQKESLEPWHQLARNYVKQAVTLEKISLNCQSFADLPTVMRWISNKVTEARCLAREIGYASFNHKISVDNFSVSLQVLDISSAAKYLVTINLDPEEYEHNEASFSIKQEIGKINEENLMKKLKKVQTGENYFTRLVSVLKT